MNCRAPVWTAISVVVAGCLSVHRFPSDVCPDLTATETPDVTVTCGDLYTMKFGANGAHYPTSFVVGGTELVAGSGDCTDERGVGVALNPAFRASGYAEAGQLGGTVTGTAKVDLHGAADGVPIVKVSLDWTNSLTATGCNNAKFHGHSIWGFFPDGRISRFEWVDVSADADVVPAACACSAGNWFVTSYLTLATTSPSFDVTGTFAPQPTDQSTRNPIETHLACATTGSQQIAFGWSEQNPAVVRRPDANSLAFDYDLDEDMVLAKSFTQAVHETILVGQQQSCSDLQARAAASIQGEQITFNAASNDVPVSDDGVYGGEAYNTDPQMHQPLGYPTAIPATLGVGQTATGKIHGGFAVALAPETSGPYDIHRSSGDPAGTWYKQGTIGSTVVLWFASDLEAGDTITIGAR